MENLVTTVGFLGWRPPLFSLTGLVVALCGIFPNPESLAHGGSGLPQQPLYRVEFSQGQVWERYAGPAGDKLLVDIYEHWLDPA